MRPFVVSVIWNATFSGLMEERRYAVLAATADEAVAASRVRLGQNIPLRVTEEVLPASLQRRLNLRAGEPRRLYTA